MFDCAIIGTSPICLLEALFRHQAGEKIVLLDDAPQIGGVWAVSPILGNDPIEIYCHILTYDRPGYEYLRQLFPNAFAPLPYEPEILVYRPGELSSDQRAILRSRLPFTSARYRHLQDNEALIRSGQGLAGLGYRLKEAFDVLIRQQRHIYPIGGFAEIINRLAAAVAKTDITVKLGTKVEALRGNTQDPTVELVTLQGIDRASLMAKQVVVTTRTGLQKINIDGEDLTLIGSHNVTSFRHLIAEITTPSPSRYSYIDLRNHPNIRRAQNITLTNNLRRKSDGLDVETHIIQMNITPDEAVIDSDTLMAEMRSMKALHPDARIIASCYTDKSRVNIESSAVKTLKSKLPTQVQILNTNNLSRAIASHQDRWQKISQTLAFR